MTKQSELIDCLKSILFIVSDYGLAQRWQVEQTRISQYRRNRLRIPIEFIQDIANETGLDAFGLIRSIELDRAQKRGQDITKRILWKPNEKIRRYPPPWVERKHWIRKKR